MLYLFLLLYSKYFGDSKFQASYLPKSKIVNVLSDLDSHVRPRLLVIGGLPPPFIGPTIALNIVLRSDLAKDFEVLHLDTSDHRGSETLGRHDFTNYFLSIKSYFRLMAMLFRYRPDLVYLPICQTTAGFLRDSAYIVTCGVFRRKIVIHLRGGYFREMFENQSWLMKLYVRRVLAGVDAAIVLGESLRYIFEGLLPKERIVVVPNGGDFLYDRELRANGEPRMVLFLSNLQETKGVFEVLGAAQLVLRKCKDVKFVIAGEERIMKGKLREVMKEKNLESAVECVGTVTGNEKAKLFASADIFILPTFYPYEGHPWVIIEAMAAGLPIVTTDQGCIRESVIDGINGFIVPKRDEKILADRILLLLEDDALRAELGRQGRALYNQNFTEKNFIGNLKGVFQRVLACEDHRSAD